jgi:hypothetical protein
MTPEGLICLRKNRKYGVCPAPPQVIVGQSLRRYQEHIKLICPQSPLNPQPIRLVAGIDGFRSDSDVSSGRDLVSHQGKERRNQKRAPGPLIAKKSRGKKVDQALAPTGSLND